MPQVDKTTFAPIAFWTFILYTGGYLVLSSSSLYSFVTSCKYTTKLTKVLTFKSIAATILSGFALSCTWILL